MFSPDFLKTDREAEDASEDAISQAAQEVRKKNKDFLASQAESWFGVLFNLFTSASVMKDERGPIGEVIRVWCGAASSDVSLGKFYYKPS